MKSLKDRLMFWRSGKAPVLAVPTFDYHNELLIASGAFVSLDILDYRDKTQKVTAYTEWRREILGATFRFTDYSFEDEKIKLRAFDDSADKDDNIWLLKLYHEQAFDAAILESLTTACENDEPFYAENDDGTTVYFRRLGKLKEPHLAYTYPGKSRFHYWDFYNEANVEEFFYVEQNLETGFIQMWLAERVPLANIFVV